MAFGLGRNSPIVLSQSRANFEAMVDRHSQYCRWRTAKKCPCVTENNRFDIHCPHCGGSGDIYDYQKEYEDIFRVKVKDNIFEIPEEYRDSIIIEIYDSLGKRYQYKRYDDYVEIDPIKNSEYVDVRIKLPIVKHLESSTLEKVGGGYYRVPEMLVEPSKFEGVYYRAAGDVISIGDLKDGDNPVNILGYRRDMVLTDSTAETLTATDIEYVMPFKFMVLSQNFTKADQKLIDTHNGEAICTFPYMYNLSENDVITILSGSMTHKIIITKKSGDDLIPEFFVSQVDSVETKTDSYKEGADFILIGTNKIHWIGKQPSDTEMMSITYRYYPTYRVSKEIPMLRTGENQRMPRKVMLKLYAAYSEAKRVNVNG
jgi:hypothetical protein